MNKHLIVNVSVHPEHQEVGGGEADAEVQTGRVVDLGIPAAQEEGHDGQRKEEQADGHTHSVQPLQEGVLWRRLVTNKRRKRDAGENIGILSICRKSSPFVIWP